MISKSSVIFRVDSSSVIGIGHFMRCLTLADSLAKHDCKIIFISRELQGNINHIAVEKGYELVRLPAQCKNEMDDISQVESIVAAIRPAWLICDHYAIDASWHMRFMSGALKLMVIDDLANRKYCCDLLLDQNYYKSKENRYIDLVPKNCIQLLGPNYLLLRNEFVSQRPAEYIYRHNIKNIMICYGGADPSSETLKILQAFKGLGLNGVKVHVLIRKLFSHFDTIIELAEHDPNIHLYLDCFNPVTVMKKCDIAFGAVGTMTWERLCMGLPTICTAVASNQMVLAEDLSHAGYIEYLGPSSKVKVEDYAHSMLSIADDCKPINQRGLAGFNLVDGQGTERIVQRLID